jgi:hypothetical protein
MEARHLMKRGLTAVLAGALAAVLLVPAAAATPGNGNGNGNGNGHGNGHGPPAWAGGGNGGGGGKPAGAGNSDKKAENAARKAERQAARDDAVEDGDGPKHTNPAWVCKVERDRDAAAFAEEYGDNGNKANAFGKCVSREAHDRDGLTPEVDETTEPGDEDTTEGEDEETSDPGDSPDEDEAALPASVQAFLHYLWPFLF